MGQITVLRTHLEAIVEQLLDEGEEVTVAAAESTYEAGLSKLGFAVTVRATPERLDDLLEPGGGVRAALEASGHRPPPQVRRSSGHQPLQGGGVGVTWLVQILI